MSNTTVDPKEIDKFAQHAKDWWDPNGPMKPLHHINPTRVKWIVDALPKAQLHGLDIGCGGGILTEALAAHHQMAGIDACSEMIEIAKQHSKTNSLKIQYHHRTSDQALKLKKRYDFITCLELLEHVESPASIVEDCAKLVKPGGWVFFSTINRNIIAFMTAIVGAEYCLGLLPKGTHQYQRLIKPSELDRFCRHADLRLLAMTGMGYNPFAGSAFLTESTSINYLVCYQRPAD